MLLLCILNHLITMTGTHRLKIISLKHVVFLLFCRVFYRNCFAFFILVCNLPHPSDVIFFLDCGEITVL